MYFMILKKDTIIKELFKGVTYMQQVVIPSIIEIEYKTFCECELLIQCKSLININD